MIFKILGFMAISKTYFFPSLVSGLGALYQFAFSHHELLHHV